MKFLQTFTVLVLLAHRPSTASATPNFPDVIAGHLDLASTPSCSLCHAGTPSRATVTTAFGIAVRSRGAAAYDDASLRAALDALAAEKKDSNGDGVSDIDELKAGGNPNGVDGDSVAPDYGCSAPRTSRSPATAMVVALVLFALRLRTRAKRAVDS